MSEGLYPRHGNSRWDGPHREEPRETAVEQDMGAIDGVRGATEVPALTEAQEPVSVRRVEGGFVNAECYPTAGEPDWKWMCKEWEKYVNKAKSLLRERRVSGEPLDWSIRDLLAELEATKAERDACVDGYADAHGDIERTESIACGWAFDLGAGQERWERWAAQKAAERVICEERGCSNTATHGMINPVLCWQHAGNLPDLTGNATGNPSKYSAEKPSESAAQRGVTEPAKIFVPLFSRNGGYQLCSHCRSALDSDELRHGRGFCAACWLKEAP